MTPTPKPEKCECPENGVVGPNMERLYSDEEKSGMNHEPGECIGTNNLCLYERDGKKMFLCSCCHLSGDKRITPPRSVPQPPAEKAFIPFCSRCGVKFPQLGRVLKYGKHYPAAKIKYADGHSEELKATDEIKQAVCVPCANELFDNDLISQARKEADAKAWALATKTAQELWIPEAVQKERELIRKAMNKASGGGSWRRVLEQALSNPTIKE